MMQVLVVRPQRDVRALAEAASGGERIEIVVADDWAEGLLLFANATPPMVLVDLYDGVSEEDLSMISRMREADGETYIIALGPGIESISTVEVIDAGASLFVSKALDDAVVVKLVLDIFEAHKRATANSRLTNDPAGWPRRDNTIALRNKEEWRKDYVSNNSPKE